MKHLKKLTALILAVCMLIGMPLSLDVAATGQPETGSYAMPFQAVQALLIPKQWNTGLNTDLAVSLYFTGNVTIDTTKIQAYITLVNSQDLAAVVDPVAGKIDNTASITTIWNATISTSPALGAHNNYVVTLDPHGSRYYHSNLDTVAEILALAHKTGLRPVVRLREISDLVNSVQKPNNSLPGIYDTNDSKLASTPNGVDQWGCQANGQVNQTSGGHTDANSKINCYDYVDIPLTSLSQAPSLKYVESDGIKIRPVFSHAMKWDGRSSSANPTHLRVVNSKGQIMYTNGSSFKNEKAAASDSSYYAIGNFANTTDPLGLCRDTFFATGQPRTLHTLSSIPYESTTESTTRDWTDVYNDCQTKCAELNQRRYGGETYTVALVIEENESELYDGNGDAVNNWRIDGMWADGYVPLTATHSNASLGINDRVIVPVLSSEELKQAALSTSSELALKDVAFISSPGKADRVIVEFTKPVSTISGLYSGLRVYKSDGNVPSYNGTDMQWGVGAWKKANASGTQWINTLTTRFDANTLAGAQEWLVNNNYATQTNGKFQMKDGYRLEFAIADSSGVQKNRMIDNLLATDGTALFANDSPFNASEERASVSHEQFKNYNMIQIDEVNVYADKYVLIDFSDNVTFDITKFDYALCVYDKDSNTLAGCNADESTYGAYNVNSLSTDIQRKFKSISYYGNRKDILVATMNDGDYAWLCEYLNKANTWSETNGGLSSRFDLGLRLQDIKSALSSCNLEYAVDGIAALDNNFAHLYAPNAGDESTVYALPNYNSNTTKIAELTGVTITDQNKAVISFSTEIDWVDSSKISLTNADGSESYPITTAVANGTTDVTVTFNNVALHDGLGIRIGDGENYLIPSSIITTKDGSVIYANETANSAYLPAVATEAIAKAKLNDTYYIEFQTAWSQRKDGDTIQLLDHLDMTSQSALVVPAGVTLDLNGYTLTVPYFVSFGNVIDSSNEKGLLKIGKSTASFAKLQAENTYLPLYDISSAGYRFFSYDIVNMGVKETTNSDGEVTILKYGIQLLFDNNLAYTLLRDAANADASLTFTITLRYPNTHVRILDYTFSSATLSNFAEQYQPGSPTSITLTISGIKSIAAMAEGQPTSISIDTHSAIHSGTGVMHDSTAHRYDLGITPAQAAFNWINERINHHDLVSFSYVHDNGEDMSSLANRSYWTTPTITTTGTYDATNDWTRKLVYTNKLRGNLSLTLDISFNAKHASIEWVGSWNYSGTDASYAIADVRILNAPFTIDGAVMTTARQGGQNYIYDYQPYSVDLAPSEAEIKAGITTKSHPMANTGGRSSQGAWPYFDLTSAHNTYGIMGAIGWTGNWMCNFTYDYNNGAVTVESGMQNTNYQMKSGETLRTPSMVIQFFKGTQDDGHNAWRQLILDQYTPEEVHTYGENNTPCAPITINTWGGIGEAKMLDILESVKANGQYFEYQWIDAGWYGDHLSVNGDVKITTTSGVTDQPWHLGRGDWYYNKTGYPNGFKGINDWHATYQKDTGRDTGLIVWFEPGYVSPHSNLALNGNQSTGGYFNSNIRKTWFNTYLFKDFSEVDYGNPSALEYIKAIVLYNLNDMQADIYRQDFNSSNLPACWASTDKKDTTATYRTGVAEIKYVMGHYDLLDTILNAGYQIDNCASGGRLLDIEMMKRSIPLWRIDYSGSNTVASGVRSQGANLSWWLPISGAAGSAEGLNTEYTFRSTMASGVTMGVLDDPAHAKKMIDELLHNREMMMGDYYILQQGLHESLKWGNCTHHPIECWVENDASKDYTNTTNAAYEYYLEEKGEGYLVAFRPNYSKVATETFKLKGLDAHADYEVRDADTGETFVRTGRYLMEQGLKLDFANPCTSHMIYFTKQ